MINEVNSNGGDGDYVEFINTGTAAIDISGWSFTDALPATDAGTRPTYTFPSGTTVAGGGIISLFTDSVADGGAEQFPFGLASSDSIILHNAAGAMVDSYTWTAHVAPHGRCPNGTGAFRLNNSRTKGAANDCSALDGGTP